MRIQINLLKTSVSLIEAFPFNANDRNNAAASISPHFINVSGYTVSAAFLDKPEIYGSLVKIHFAKRIHFARQQPASELMAPYFCTQQ